MVLGDGPQPVIEGAAPQGKALADHPEAAAIVQGDHRVEPAPALEFHLGFQAVHAGGQGCRQAVYQGHGVHAADEQCQPLPGPGVGPHEVRRRVVAQDIGGFGDALLREIVAVAGRQMGRAVAHPSGQASLQQGGQGAVHRRQRLAQDQRQFPRVDEGHEAEVVE